jgi:predicted HTH transcriptional regulator
MPLPRQLEDEELMNLRRSFHGSVAQFVKHVHKHYKGNVTARRIRIIYFGTFVSYLAPILPIGASIREEEGLELEFKKGDYSIDTIGKPLCAFLNNGALRGGTLMVGVRDCGVVHGVRLSQFDQRKFRDELEGLMVNDLQCSVHDFRLTFVPTNTNRSVIKIDVFKAKRPLRAFKGRQYLRSYGATLQMTQCQVERLQKLRNI